MLDTGSQKSMVGMEGWEIIKRHDTCIYAEVVNMGGSSNAGFCLQLVNARGVVKNRLDVKRYLVIVRKAFFNPNSYKTLLEKYQIKFFGVQVYLHPRVFCGKYLIDARDQVGHSVKLGIYWYGSTIYLDIHPSTREDFNRLGFLHITCVEPYSPYIPFGRSTSQLKLDKPCLCTGRVKITWTNKKIQEWRQRLGYFISHLVKNTFEASTQDYPGVRHKCEVMPKKSSVVSFPILPYPVCSIRFNKESFSVYVLEDTHSGGNH